MVSLQEARERAFENRRAVAHGRNPLAEKKQAIKAATVPTFKMVAEKYYEENRPRWKAGRHTDRWLQVVEKYAFPAFGDVLVDRVGREDMLRMLTPIWTAKPEYARKLRQRVRLILDCVKRMGTCTPTSRGNRSGVRCQACRVSSNIIEACPIRKSHRPWT